MWEKPVDLFERDAEWGEVADFAADARVGATLALVYGRRRQGKTMLLESLIEAAGGFLFTGLEQSSAQNLTALGGAYGRSRNLGVPVAFPNWTAAIDEILSLGEGSRSAVPVVLDEFPYLTATAPELPSVIQNALSPRGRARRRSKARLILCGSAFSVMRGLLGGSAPLRGRAPRDVLLHPFDYRTAAAFWEVAGEWDLAVRLHALVGGTPAYRDYATAERPRSTTQLGRWAARHLLNPASAFFREGRVLLAEDTTMADAGLYLSVLAALAAGSTRRGQIAAALGRKETALAHPLRILEETRLINRVANPLHERRTTYRIAEPVLRFHQLIISPHEARLTRHLAAPVWEEAAPTIESNIYGPHLEDLAREWASYHASVSTLGAAAQTVGAADIPCRQHRGHQVDIVATHAGHVTALGEAKWRTVGLDDLERLRHIRDITPRAGGAHLLLFTATGADRSLRSAATRRDVHLVDLERLYTGD